MRLIDGQGRLWGRLNLLDGIALFLLLFASALTVHFIRHDFLRHTALTIELVEPKRFTPGVDEFLSVSGNAFGQDPIVRINDSDPLMSYQVNETQIALKPPPDLTPGWPVVSVRNRKGRVSSAEGLFEVVWKPVITHLTPLETGNQSLYLLSGEYLEPNCTVEWNGKTVTDVALRSRRELEVSVPANDVPLTRLVLRNPSGGVTVVEGRDLLEQLRPKTADADWVPQIEMLIPPAIHVNRDSELMVVGAHFAEDCAVRVGDRTFTDITVVKPYLLAVSIPIRSLPFGMHPVEVINPNGKIALFQDGLMVREEALAEVVLRFEGLNRDQMKWFRQAPPNKSGDTVETPLFFRILKKQAPRRARSRGEWKQLNGMVEIQAFLPVLRKPNREYVTYSSEEIPLVQGEVVPVQILTDRPLPAIVVSSPKLVQLDS